MCINDPQWCIRGAGSITITATNWCPPNYQKKTDIWCNPPQKHFDLSMPMFLKIAQYKAGVVPVKFRRVPCQRRGGVKFQFGGNPYFLMVLVFNVGGAGDVTEMQVKGTRTNWIQMKRNWGMNWQTGTVLTGQALSFRVKTSDGKFLEMDNVAPWNWGFGQTFAAQSNF
ncbi:PREDICTED: expansin-A23-like isoform X2 [Tarenaya hassleriana]|nr:PREDICTED: expansin-A23-like isoform X2 [Tarenaya hassleriana]